MPLLFIRDAGYDFRRLIYQFVASDGRAEHVCGVTFSAMDDHESLRGTKRIDRAAQFARLRARILDVASQRFDAGDVEPDGGGYTVLVFSRHLNGGDGER